MGSCRICGDCQQVMNRNSDDDVWEPEKGLRQLQKEIVEHQCELLAKDTDIHLLKQRVAELEGAASAFRSAVNGRRDVNGIAIFPCECVDGEGMCEPCQLDTDLYDALSRKDGE